MIKRSTIRGKLWDLSTKKLLFVLKCHPSVRKYHTIIYSLCPTLVLERTFDPFYDYYSDRMTS